MSWQPAAPLAALRRRAAALATIRAFFAARGVLEVQTAALVNAAVTDPHIESFAVPDTDGTLRYLHTSPEYAMKRLLAAGSGDIFQVCSVFRRGERSRLHNPEFTLVEWYRLGYSLDALMDETAALVGALLRDPASDDSAPRAARPVERVSYRDALLRELGLELFDADTQRLHARLVELAIEMGLERATAQATNLDDLLDLMMAARVGPRLGWDALTCLHRYPASQAALAQLDPADARVALRFELYADGLELANGFVELGDACEQRARFSADLAARAAAGAHADARLDEHLLAALAAGLPACAGVAVGLDRVLMVAGGAPAGPPRSTRCSAFRSREPEPLNHSRARCMHRCACRCAALRLR